MDLFHFTFYFSSESTIKRRHGRNLEGGTEAEITEEHSLMPLSTIFSIQFKTISPGDGTTHGGLVPPISVSKQV